MFGKCGNYMVICPFSLGLAVGLTSFFAVLIWSIWVLSHGVPPEMAVRFPADFTFARGLMLAFWALIKGFVFGFFVALFYDLIKGCAAKYWGKRGDHCQCCGRGNVSTENQPRV